MDVLGAKPGHLGTKRVAGDEGKTNAPPGFQALTCKSG